MHVLAHAPLTLLLLVSFSPESRADEPAEGFALEQLPGFASDSTSVTLSTGEYVVNSIYGVFLYGEDGVLVQTLELFFDFQLPGPIAVDPTETFVVFSTEGTFLNGMRRLDLTGGTSTYITYLTGSDIVFGDANNVYVSSFSLIASQSKVFDVDLTTGDFDTIIDLQGRWVEAIARDAAGNLFVPNGDFDGPWRILEYSAAQLAGGTTLFVGDGSPVAFGRERSRGIAATPDGSTLYVVEDPLSGSEPARAFELVLGATPRLLLELTTPPLFNSLQLLPGTGPAEFLPYQPPGGDRLLLRLEGATSERHILAPARPVASVDGVGTSGTGPFDLELEGGPPGGTAIVFYSLASLYNPVETYFQLQVPLAMGLPLGSAFRVPGVLSLDANGAASMPYVNATGSSGVWALQAILFDDAGALVGSSTAAIL